MLCYKRKYGYLLLCQTLSESEIIMLNSVTKKLEFRYIEIFIFKFLIINKRILRNLYRSSF